MAKFMNARIYMGTVDFTLAAIGTATRRWELILAVDPLDPTSVTDAGERTIAGIRKDSINWDGLFDDSTSHNALLTSIGTRTFFYVTFIGSGIGNVGYAAKVEILANKPSTKIGELVAQAITLGVDGTIEHGVALAIETSFGSGTVIASSLDNGTQTTNGWAYYNLVHPPTNATINVQHSTSGTGSWVTLLGPLDFSGYTADIGDIRSWTGTDIVFRYVRLLKTGVNTGTFSALFSRR